MVGEKVKNAKKGASKAVRIGGLADYVRAPEQRTRQEKCLYYGARGFLTDTPAGHRVEMIALAQDAVRSPDPVNHYVLSWRQGEEPTARQVEQAVDLVLDELGLTDHQALYGLHGNTDNIHLHLVVNRVHPLPLFADAIREGRVLAERVTARRRVWECIEGPLAGRLFVGGILPEGAGPGAWGSWGPWSPYIWAIVDEFEPRPVRRAMRVSDAPFVLSPPVRFFGVERATMQAVKRVAREGLEAASSIEQVAVPEEASAVSLLRDGTVLGPADYFVPVGVMEL